MLRRCYATVSRHPLALLARTESTPLAVQDRRARRRTRLGLPALKPGKSDANAAGLTPTELARYTRMKHIGELGAYGKEPTEAEWLEALDTRRSRVRGIAKITRADGKTETRVVGKKVYLPNIIFKLVPNSTPPGEKYNPFEATFRIPHSITKTDIRSYLQTIYGVECTYIRTDNYFSPMTHRNRQRVLTTSPHRSYKRAVVGLVKPFYFPQLPENMSPQDAENRLEWIQKYFAPDLRRESVSLQKLRMTQRAPSTTGFRWRGATTKRREFILQTIAEQRSAREATVADYVQEWQGKRERKEKITLDRNKLKTVNLPKTVSLIKKRKQFVQDRTKDQFA